MTYDQWFRSQQGIPYEGQYLFAEAAWEHQADKIQQMALEYISEQGQWIDGIAKYKALCDQLGNALQNCANNEDDVMLTREALAAWREMEGGCDVPNSE